MIPILRKILLLAALAGAMLFATDARTQNRPAGNQVDRRPVEGDPDGRRPGPCLFGPRMMYALEMTGAQQNEVDRLYLAAEKDADDLSREVLQEESRLLALRAAPERSAKKIAAVLGNLDALHRQIDARWRRFRDDVLDLLTEEQLARYHFYRSRDFGPGADDAPGWYRGRGRGCGRGWGCGRDWGCERDWGCGRGRGRGWGRGRGAGWWRQR